MVCRASLGGRIHFPRLLLLILSAFVSSPRGIARAFLLLPSTQPYTRGAPKRRPAARHLVIIPHIAKQKPCFTPLCLSCHYSCAFLTYLRHRPRYPHHRQGIPIHITRPDLQPQIPIAPATRHTPRRQTASTTRSNSPQNLPVPGLPTCASSNPHCLHLPAQHIAKRDSLLSSCRLAIIPDKQISPDWLFLTYPVACRATRCLISIGERRARRTWPLRV